MNDGDTNGLIEIVLYKHGDDPEPWRAALAQHLRGARVRVWHPGDTAPAHYAIVWRPPAELLRTPGLRAVFNLGAGADALMTLLQEHPALLPREIPIIRLHDAGMGRQMAQYVCYAVLKHFRQMDRYAAQQRHHVWKELEPRREADYPVGVLGLGVLGMQVARALAGLGFHTRGWARTEKKIEGVQCYQGSAALPQFLAGLGAVVNVLPLTQQTENILNRNLFTQLAQGAMLVSVGRGAHLTEQDLLEALDSGQLSYAMLDVFQTEPLPSRHPFWDHPKIDLTPHVSALTELQESVEQICSKISALERGIAVPGVVDRERGY